MDNLIKIIPLEPDEQLGPCIIKNCIGRGGSFIAYSAFLDHETFPQLVIIKELCPNSLMCQLQRNPKTKIIELKPEYKHLQKELDYYQKKQTEELKILEKLKDTKGENNSYFFNSGCFFYHKIPYTILGTNGGKILSDMLSKRTSTNKIEEFDSLSDVLEFSKRILEAIEPIHAKNYLHADISPDNLYVLNLRQDNQASRHTVIAIDFNNCFHLDQKSQVALDWKENYSPIEYKITNQTSKRTFASDLYSVAMILFVMIYGFPLPSVRVFQHDKDFKNNIGKFDSPYFSDEEDFVVDATKALLQKALASKARLDDCSAFHKEIKTILDLIQFPNKLVSNFIPSEKKCLGRNEQIEEIHQSFSDENTVVLLKGIGGVGKTSIAQAYTKKYQDFYSTIIFIRYKENLLQTITSDKLLPITNFSKKPIDPNNSMSPEERQKKYYKEKFELLQNLIHSEKEHGNQTLIVIDNMNNGLDPQFQDLHLLGGHVLVTTRNNFANKHPISIDPLTSKESTFDIFKEYYKFDNISPEDKIIIQDILYRTGSLPLIIELIALALYESRTTIKELVSTFSDTYFSYPDEPIDYTQIHGVTDDINEQNLHREQSVRQILVKIFGLSELAPAEQNVLMHLSLIPYGGMKTKIFKELCGFDNYKAINQLIKIGIINHQDQSDCISLHQVVSDTCRALYNPTCESCEALFSSYTNQITCSTIKTADAYLEAIDVFTFIAGTHLEKQNDIFIQYQLSIAILMIQFNEFYMAEKYFQEITTWQCSDVYKYNAYRYLFTIAVEKFDLAPSYELLEILENWDMLKEYKEIHLGVIENKGWLYAQSKKEEEVQAAISIFTQTLQEENFDIDLFSHPTPKEVCFVDAQERNIIKRLCNFYHCLGKANYELARKHAYAPEFLEKALYNLKGSTQLKTLYFPTDKDLTFTDRNLEAECYARQNKYIEAIQIHEQLLSDKLTYYSVPNHTIAITYRNLIGVQKELFLKDPDVYQESILSHIGKLVSIAKKNSFDGFIAYSYDISLQVYQRIEDGEQIIQTAISFFELLDNYTNLNNTVVDTYQRYSQKRIQDFLQSDISSRLDYVKKEQLINLYDNCKFNK